jgi:polysaccharide biosynthesis protein PslH
MKKVLIIIPYHEIYPPMNGGMLRCFHILHQLSKYYKVTAIIHQDKAGFLKATDEYPSLANCTILSTKDSPEPKDLFALFPGRMKDALRYRYWKRTLKGPADSNFLLYYPTLRRVLKQQAFDYVILENLSTLNAAPVVRQFNPSAFLVYDAHNVDTLLVRQLADKSNTAHIEKAETSLGQLVDAVLACSEGDLREFRRMNKQELKGAVIPNGIEITPATANQPTVMQEGQLLFCGSLDYAPNREGLLWFCERIFPLLLEKEPGIKLMVVGKGEPGELLRNRLNHSSVVYYGAVESVAPYYEKAAVAVVPLRSGSGTRLKVLEAMAKRVAIVSTSKGAEGIEYTDGKNICIADDERSFAENTLNLLHNRTLSLSLANEGFALVKQLYDWEVVGRGLKVFLDKSAGKAL